MLFILIFYINIFKTLVQRAIKTVIILYGQSTEPDHIFAWVIITTKDLVDTDTPWQQSAMSQLFFFTLLRSVL